MFVSSKGRTVPLALGAILVAAIPLAAQSATESVASDLSDPEVAHVAVTANSIDVELARLAETRAASAEVRRFARTMISDHTAVNEKAAALAKRLGVTPADNAVSRSLQEGAAEARSRLEGLRGSAFDQAYMDREVAYHAAVLDALDVVLIPTTQNEELRALVVEVRPAIAMHLEDARRIRASLGGNP